MRRLFQREVSFSEGRENMEHVVQWEVTVRNLNVEPRNTSRQARAILLTDGKTGVYGVSRQVYGSRIN